MKRMLTVTLVVLALAGVLAIASGYTRDLSGSDSKAILVAVEGVVVNTGHSTSVTAVTVDTWTALSGIGDYRFLQIVCRNTTDAATATLNIWGSDDGGTTYFPMVRADTLAKAKDVAIDVGTNFSPTEGASLPNVDTVVVSAGPSTHIYIDAESGATAGFTYEVGGL